MNGFSPLLLLLITGINFTAAFLQACSGFGYAILAMSLMPLALPLRMCSAISAVTVVAIAIQMVTLLRMHISFRIVAIPVACCILSTNIGMYVLMHTPENTMRLILALLIIMLTLFFAITQKLRVKINSSLKNGILFGFLTGLSTGMFNIVGPFFMVYYFNTCKDNLGFKASLEFSFLIAGLYSTALHIWYGNINAVVLPYAFGSAVAAVAAGFIGIRLFKKINNVMLRRIILVALPIMALLLTRDLWPF